MLPLLKPPADSPGRIFRNRPALILSQRGKDSQQNFTLRIQRINILLFENNANPQVALAEFRELCPDLPIKNIALDSAHDNYPTYHLCSEWKITPFIDLNPKNNGNLTYPGAVTVNEKGKPVCMAVLSFTGFPLVLLPEKRNRQNHRSCSWAYPVESYSSMQL